MKRLYFTRHGESQTNLGNLWGNTVGAANDLPLTDLGRQQALETGLAAKTAGIKPDRILCSPLLRTRETAAIIARELGFAPEDIEYSDLLVEVQVGELEDTPYFDYWDKYTYADLGKFKGTETIEKLQQRAARALAYAQSLPDDDILIVAHSCFGRALRRVVAGEPYTHEFTHGESLPYATIMQLLPRDEVDALA